MEKRIVLEMGRESWREESPLMNNTKIFFFFCDEDDGNEVGKMMNAIKDVNNKSWWELAYNSDSNGSH